MAEPILTVEHLIKAYGETPVLDDISFAVKPGEVTKCIGATYTTTVTSHTDTAICAMLLKQRKDSWIL